VGKGDTRASQAIVRIVIVEMMPRFGDGGRVRDTGMEIGRRI